MRLTPITKASLLAIITAGALSGPRPAHARAALFACNNYWECLPNTSCFMGEKEKKAFQADCDEAAEEGECLISNVDCEDAPPCNPLTQTPVFCYLSGLPPQD